MTNAQLITLLLLACVLAGWIVIAVMVRRQKEMAERLSRVVATGAFVQPQGLYASNIRIRRSPGPRRLLVVRLMNIPTDLPLAHVIQPPWVFVAATAAAAAAAWVGHFLLSWPVCLGVSLLVWILLVRGIFAWEIERYQGKLIRQLPDTIQLVISATRAGLPVTEAFRAIAQEMPSPTREEFIRAENEMAMGGTPDEALLSLHQRTGVAEYAIFAVTIGVQARSGGRLAETVQNLAETVRERLAIAARAKALASEAQASAVIMGILPVVSGLGMSVLRPGYLDPLFHDPRGVKMFTFGIGTFVMGILAMRQLIRGATRD